MPSCVVSLSSDHRSLGRKCEVFRRGQWRFVAIAGGLDVTGAKACGVSNRCLGFSEYWSSHAHSTLVFRGLIWSRSRTSQDQIFSQILGGKFGVGVYNLSYIGSPYNAYLNLAIEYPRLKVQSPAVVVWTFFNGKDLTDPYGDVWEPEALPWQGGIEVWRVKFKTFRDRSPLRKIARGLESQLKGIPYHEVIIKELPDGRKILFADHQEKIPRLSKKTIQEHANFPKLKTTLFKMKEFTLRHQLALFIFIIPTKGEVYRWILENRAPTLEDQHPSGLTLAVLEACGEIGVRCVDTTAHLIQKGVALYGQTGELLWWRDDTHINDQGHEALAELMAQKIGEVVRVP